jgi:hypothetical protein
VTVKGYVDRVEVVDGPQVVARHSRSYGRDEQALDPLHYLATLGRRPAALDHAPVLRDWKLPESFARPRQALEARHGAPAGARQYVRVLQLLAEHPPRAGPAGRRGLPVRRGLACQAHRLCGGPAGRGGRRQRAGPRGDALDQYQVPRPDLGRYNQLLTQGDSQDG